MSERQGNGIIVFAVSQSTRSAVLRWIFALATLSALIFVMAEPSRAQSQGTASKSATAGNVSLTRAKAVANYTSLPLMFEANQGQTDPRVKFLSRAAGYTLFLTDRRPSFHLRLGRQHQRLRIRGNNPGLRRR